MAQDTAHTARRACTPVNWSQVAKDTAHTAQRLTKANSPRTQYT